MIATRGVLPTIRCADSLLSSWCSTDSRSFSVYFVDKVLCFYKFLSTQCTAINTDDLLGGGGGGGGLNKSI